MNNLIKFYNNLYPANNKKNYFFADIVKKWDDYKLEVKHDFVQWLFPDETGGVNSNAPKLTKNDIKQFRTDAVLRSNVVEATLRMLLFYGFVIDGTGVKQIKPLNRRDRGRTIGLFSVHNYKRLTRIMDFLVQIDMEYLSALFFLSLCQAIKSNYMLLKKVLTNKSLKTWMSTQNYLVSNIHTYDVRKLSKTVIPSDSEDDEGSWDINFAGISSSDESEDIGEEEEEEDEVWEDIPSDLLYHSDEEKEEESSSSSSSPSPSPKRGPKCPVTGLDYTGNSCYMDSALLSMFAIPNKTITDHILNKDLTTLKTIDRRLWSNCHDNIDNDIKRRKAIQKALVDITESMRGPRKVKKCSNLRSLIKRCPGSQPFHERDTQDSGEFLSYLFNLFQVDVATTRRRTYGSNDLIGKPKWTLVREQKDQHSSPIIDVTSGTLRELPKDYNITKFVKQKQDAIFDAADLWTPDKVNAPLITYTRRKEVTRTQESPIVIFNLVRSYGEVSFAKPHTKKEKEAGRGEFKGIKQKNTWVRVNAPESMTLKGKKLELSAIVVHTGGAHYVTNFKCNGEWFWYDDNPGGDGHKIEYTGSYENMLKTTPKPLTHGTIFFYT
jgi:hypothetical protein